MKAEDKAELDEAIAKAEKALEINLIEGGNLALRAMQLLGDLALHQWGKAGELMGQPLGEFQLVRRLVAVHAMAYAGNLALEVAKGEPVSDQGLWSKLSTRIALKNGKIRTVWERLSDNDINGPSHETVARLIDTVKRGAVALNGVHGGQTIAIGYDLYEVAPLREFGWRPSGGK